LRDEVQNLTGLRREYAKRNRNPLTKKFRKIGRVMTGQGDQLEFHLPVSLWHFTHDLNLGLIVINLTRFFVNPARRIKEMDHCPTNLEHAHD
jgi:hypothetical protein